MEDIVKSIDTVFGWQHKKGDDVFDRLNNRYTVLILTFFTGIVSFYHITGEPISCWAPNHFTSAHAVYTNSFCWVNDTYYLPFEERIPRDNAMKNYVRYYQWVPFMLFVQAMGFYFPSVVWHGLNFRAGVDCDSILATVYLLTKVSF